MDNDCAVVEELGVNCLSQLRDDLEVISRWGRIKECRFVEVLANHATTTEDKVLLRELSYDPEHTCLVVLNHVGLWERIPEDLRRRFRLILWFKRYNHQGHSFHGLYRSPVIVGDNVIPLFLNGWESAYEGVFVQLPALTALQKNLRGILRTKYGTKQHPTTGGIVAWIMRGLTGAFAQLRLLGFSGKYDPNKYMGHPIGHEHRLQSDYGIIRGALTEGGQGIPPITSDAEAPQSSISGDITVSSGMS